MKPIVFWSLISGVALLTAHAALAFGEEPLPAVHTLLLVCILDRVMRKEFGDD